MPEWLISTQPVKYPDALRIMDSRVAEIRAGIASELIWLLEHPPIYTAGTSANPNDLSDNSSFQVFKTGRGGQYTYHGPGQRVIYLMLDLKKRQQTPDIKRYVYQLEEWIIRALGHFGIGGERRMGRVGIWVPSSEGETKIAAVGVRIRQWVSMHGVSVNIDPDLSHYSGITPCGIREHGITSLAKLLSRGVTMAEFDAALRAEWARVFET